MYSVICTIQLHATKYSSVTKSATVTVGKSLTIYPYSVSNVSALDCTGGSRIAILSDESAFTVTTTEKTVRMGVTCYSYSLKALKTGTYTFKNYVNYSAKVSGSGGFYTETSSVLVTYNITVVDVTKISIPSSLTLTLGDTYTFSPTITDNRASTTLTWNSSNTSVATVSSAGKITTKKVGTTIITCTASNGVSTTCTITVNPIKATNISLNISSCELAEGETIQLKSTISPSNTTNKNVEWKSSNNYVATVDGNGLVIANAPGQCNITVTTTDGSNKSAICKIKVLSDVLNIDNSIGVPSGTLVLPIQMKNISDITGMQFELQLPEGVSVAMDNANNYLVTLSDRADDQMIICSKLSNSNYQFVVFSANSKKFMGNEGAIAYVTLTISPNLTIGNYTISLKEIELTNTQGIAIHHKDMSAILTLNNVTIGDVNGDGRVTVTDAVCIVNYIHKRIPSVFITKAADANGDGAITITDAVNIINKIQNQ